jgi:hypothetical protein
VRGPSEESPCAVTSPPSPKSRVHASSFMPTDRNSNKSIRKLRSYASWITEMSLRLRNSVMDTAVQFSPAAAPHVKAHLKHMKDSLFSTITAASTHCGEGWDQNSRADLTVSSIRALGPLGSDGIHSQLYSRLWPPASSDSTLRSI